MPAAVGQLLLELLGDRQTEDSLGPPSVPETPERAAQRVPGLGEVAHAAVAGHRWRAREGLPTSILDAQPGQLDDRLVAAHRQLEAGALKELNDPPVGLTDIFFGDRVAKDRQAAVALPEGAEG